MKNCSACRKYNEEVNYSSTDFNSLCSKCRIKVTKEMDQLQKRANKVQIDNIDGNDNLNKKLDLLYEQNKNIMGEQNREQRLMSYRFAFIENIFRLSSEVMDDVHLAIEQFKNHTLESPYNFSFGYYSRNIIMKTNIIMEKVMLYYALTYDIEFNDILKDTKRVNMYEKLKKINEFKNTHFFEMNSKVVSKQVKGKDKNIQWYLSNERNYLEHDLSYKTEMNFVSLFQELNIYMELCEKIFKIIREMICLFPLHNKIITLFAMEEMGLQFPKPKTNNMTQEIFNVCMEKNSKCQKMIGEKLQYLYTQNIQYLLKKDENINIIDMNNYNLDIRNRLLDSSRGLGHLFLMIGEGARIKRNPEEIKIFDRRETDLGYFLNNSLLRIYSAQDKIARVINLKYELDAPRIYFNELKEVLTLEQNKSKMANKPNIIQKISKIVDSKSYKELYNERQNVVHKLSTYYTLGINFRFDYVCYLLPFLIEQQEYTVELLLLLLQEEV